MAKIKIELLKSVIGKPESHKQTVKALGFKKIGQVIEKDNTPQIRGMINKINYMVKVTE